MKSDISPFKDWRVAGFAGLLLGFLAGLLIFGAPWHLPPDFGDVPTWLLVVLAAIAGWVGFYQLGLLQQQIADEARRNVKRDELLDRQLAEAEMRAAYARRLQAEDIDVTRWQARTVYVDNNSRRPISQITCRILSRADLRTVAQPVKIAEVILSERPAFVYGTVQSSRYERLRPDRRCIFSFDDAFTVADEHIIVSWFTDDAGFRWQLDGYLHLVQAGDNDAYVP